MLLSEADRCKERGELGAFLRRKHIYSSMLSSWRKQLGAADSAALAPQKRTEARRVGSANQAPEPRRRTIAPQARARGTDHRGSTKTVRGTRIADRGRDERGRVMLAVTDLASQVGMQAACRAFAFNPGFRVPRSRAASWCLLATPHIGATAAAAGLLNRRAELSARRARQRALC